MPVIGSTIGNFLSLSDAPNSYSGQSGNVVSVKSTEDGLEFTAPGAGSVNFSYNVIASALTIAINQQMIVYQSITINADLTLNGDLVLID